MATNDAHSQEIKLSPMKMCPELKEFYESHGIFPEDLLGVQLTTRFVRLNPRFDKKETLALLKVISHSVCIVSVLGLEYSHMQISFWW